MELGSRNSSLPAFETARSATTLDILTLFLDLDFDFVIVVSRFSFAFAFILTSRSFLEEGGSPSSCPDIRGNRYAQCTLDQGSRYRRFKAHRDKKAATVWGAIEDLHPGSRLQSSSNPEGQVPPTFPRTFATDRGGEYDSTFHDKVVERGGMHRRSARRRAKDNSRAERNVREVETLTSAALITAGAPRQRGRRRTALA